MLANVFNKKGFHRNCGIEKGLASCDKLIIRDKKRNLCTVQWIMTMSFKDFQFDNWKS
jgi:hypothetical protein